MKPYEYGDALRDAVLEEVRNLFARRRLMTFDEINAPKLSTALEETYTRIDRIARYAFALLYEKIWGQIIAEEEEDEDDLEDAHSAEYGAGGIRGIASPRERYRDYDDTAYTDSPFAGVEADDYAAADNGSYSNGTLGVRKKNRVNPPEPHGFDGKVDRYLSGYDPVLKYVWSHELERKRGRLFESIMADLQSADKRGVPKKKAIDDDYITAQKHIERQIKQYFIDIEDDAVIEAYKAVRVEKVRWVTQKDERVCDYCDPLDEQVFPIDRVPTKHPNCRCYLVSVKG